jgi:hypothetical protein
MLLSVRSLNMSIFTVSGQSDVKFSQASTQRISAC